MSLLLHSPNDVKACHDALARGEALHVFTVARVRSVCNAAGDAIGDEERAALIESVRAGKHIELQVEIEAYRQSIEPGSPNRNGTRVAASAIQATAEAGAGAPFLKDHNWHQAAARGGTVLASRLEQSDSEQVIIQTVRLVASWAVEMALLGMLDRVSVGLLPTGPVHCTACQTPVHKCMHWPKQRVIGENDEVIIVEWELQSADLVETSYVNVPAVTDTSVGEPRLMTIQTVQRRVSAQQQGDEMAEKNELKALTDKVAALTETVGVLQTQLAGETAMRAAAEAKAKALEQRHASEAADRFVSGLAEEGKLVLGTPIANHLHALYMSEKVQAEQVASCLTAGPALDKPQRNTSSGGAAATKFTMPRGEDGKVNFAQFSDALPAEVQTLFRGWRARYPNCSPQAIALALHDELRERLALHGIDFQLIDGDDY